MLPMCILFIAKMFLSKKKKGTLSYLHEIIWCIMHQHDQSPCPDVVDQPGETDEGNGGYVVNDLLFKILQTRKNDMCINKKPHHCLVTHWLSCKDLSLINSVSLVDAGFNND